MDEEKDKKIKDYLKEDKIVSNKANKVFDDFIDSIQNETKEESGKVVSFENRKSKFYKLKKLTAIAASFVIVFIGSNVYARTMGYDNIFFMIVDLVSEKSSNEPEEIFSDKDIVISYSSFNVTEDIEIQVNELQVKDNTAKLYLNVKELEENSDAPLSYIVKNSNNEIMFDGKSTKNLDEKQYEEILDLSNYKDDTNIINLEIYNNSKVLLKTVNINLEEKTIEARTENLVIKQISQIELNKFLKEETMKCYTEKELKDKEIIILETYDIFYSDSKYIVKYLFMAPTQKEFDENKVEETDIYINTIEFNYSKEQFKTIKIEKPEKFE